MTVLAMTSPATGQPLGELRETSADEVARAVERARRAFCDWSRLKVEERVKYLRRMRSYIVEHGEELARRIALDTGKVALEAYMTEIFTTADFLAYYEANAARFLAPKPVKTPLHFWPKRSHVHYRPMGVIAVISPWNYPFQLSLVPAISALVAGNAVVLKPSEVTAYTGLVIEETLQAAGLPDGVAQVLHGGRETGQALVEARPDKIFFTGSVATGKAVMAAAARHLIPVELELGGKDPMIVFDDANLERAANAAVWGAFTNAGQVCMSVERVYVQERLYPQFVERVVEKTNALRQGIGDEADIGSMTYPHQLAVVKDHLEDALRRGARVLTGGSVPREGMFVPPTVLVDVTHEMKVMREETFGPLLPIMPFRTEEEAVRLANDSPYGLNASVWTADPERAERVALQLESGNVCINDVIVSVANPHLPFGGVKHSGIGRYHGPEGLYTFCHTVSVIRDPGKKTREINWYPYSRQQFDAITGLTRFLFGEKNVLSPSVLRAIWREWRRR